jgi:hypothetical protein
MALEDRAHLLRHRAVAAEVGRHEHRVRHRRSARIAGIAERMPNLRAS